MARRRRSSRKRRHNPAGGFLPGLAGFFLVPTAVGLAAKGVHGLIAKPGESSPVVGPIGATTTAYVVGALGAWALNAKVKDPGWSSFLTGGTWGSGLMAVAAPLAWVVLGGVALAAGGAANMGAIASGARAPSAARPVRMYA